MTPEQKELLLSYKTEFLGTMTANVVDLLLNSPSLDDDCQLTWQPHFMGGTDYLDSIRPEDLKKPIMWGIDEYKRLYVSIKTKASIYPPEPAPIVVEDTLFEWLMNSWTRFFNKDPPPPRSIGVETFFQRYSDMGSVWEIGCHHSHRVSVIKNTQTIDGMKGLDELLKTGYFLTSIEGDKKPIYYKLECIF